MRFFFSVPYTASVNITLHWLCLRLLQCVCVCFIFSLTLLVSPRLLFGSISAFPLISYYTLCELFSPLFFLFLAFVCALAVCVCFYVSLRCIRLDLSLFSLIFRMEFTYFPYLHTSLYVDFFFLILLFLFSA
jgi:hypothetical protein